MKFKSVSLSVLAMITFLLVLPSCSGGGGGGDSSGSETASTAPTLEQFVAHMVEAWGEDVGFEAIYLAFENGYSLQQVADAGFIYRLGTSGIISDGNGGTVPPEYPPTDTTRTISSAFTTDLAKLRGWLESAASHGSNISAEGAAMAMLMEMVQRGYNVSQVVEAFLFGYTIEVQFVPLGNGFEIPKWVIIDESGNIVRPNRSVDTTTFSPPATETGGGDTGGDAGGDTNDGCFINNSSILGSWSVPATAFSGGGGGYVATTYTFQAGGVGSLTSTLNGETSSPKSFSWSISCNTVTMTSANSVLDWNVTSSSTMETLVKGTMLYSTKN